MQGDCWGYCCVGVEASCMIFTCNFNRDIEIKYYYTLLDCIPLMAVIILGKYVVISPNSEL